MWRRNPAPSEQLTEQQLRENIQQSQQNSFRQQEEEESSQHKQQRHQVQKQQQIELQQRQYVAAIQAIYDVLGRTLCSFERYAQKVQNKPDMSRYTKKYEKHSVSVDQQPIAHIFEEMKSQLTVLQFALGRYRTSPEVQDAHERVKKWQVMFLGVDPMLDVMLGNLERCIKGEEMQLPETPKQALTSEGLLDAVQHFANGSAKAERTTTKIIDDPDRKAAFHVDADHPDEDPMDQR